MYVTATVTDTVTDRDQISALGLRIPCRAVHVGPHTTWYGHGTAMVAAYGLKAPSLREGG